MNFKNFKTTRAFTLIELLISITIFAIFMSTAIAAYLQLSVALQRENIDRKLYTEIESVITDIQRQAKYYDIDYTQQENDSNGGANGNRLHLVSHSGSGAIIYSTQDITAGSKTIKSIAVQKGTIGTTGIFNPYPDFAEPISLTSKELQIDRLTFSIFPFPKENPQDPNAILHQPRITITISGSIKNPYRKEPREISLQTSISMRHYNSGN